MFYRTWKKGLEFSLWKVLKVLNSYSTHQLCNSPCGCFNRLYYLGIHPPHLHFQIPCHKVVHNVFFFMSVGFRMIVPFKLLVLVFLGFFAPVLFPRFFRGWFWLCWSFLVRISYFIHFHTVFSSPLLCSWNGCLSHWFFFLRFFFSSNICNFFNM